MLNTMDILLITAGACIIAVVLIGIFAIMALSTTGWRVAVGILAIGVTLTVVVGGAALLVNGMGGHP